MLAAISSPSLAQPKYKINATAKLESAGTPHDVWLSDVLSADCTCFDRMFVGGRDIVTCIEMRRGLLTTVPSPRTIWRLTTSTALLQLEERRRKAPGLAKVVGS